MPPRSWFSSSSTCSLSWRAMSSNCRPRTPVPAWLRIDSLTSDRFASVACTAVWYWLTSCIIRSISSLRSSVCTRSCEAVWRTIARAASRLSRARLMSSWISLLNVCERRERLRTSVATTAKPRPASPARAASMDALRASRFVWSVIFFSSSALLKIAVSSLATSSNFATTCIECLLTSTIALTKCRSASEVFWVKPTMSSRGWPSASSPSAATRSMSDIASTFCRSASEVRPTKLSARAATALEMISRSRWLSSQSALRCASRFWASSPSGMASCACACP